MSTARNDFPRRWPAIWGLLSRWILGVTFIYTGCFKALHPVEFLKLIRQYDLVHSATGLDALAAWLPWFEVTCGVLLVAGVAVRGTALLVLGMLIPFTVAVFLRALALKSALAISLCMVKFDCGCGTGEVFICRKLAENAVLLALSVWLLLGGGRKGALRYQLFNIQMPSASTPGGEGDPGNADGGSFPKPTD